MTHSEDTSGLQTNLLIFQRLHKAHSLWPDWLQQKLHLFLPEEYAAHQRTNGTCLCIWKNTDSWFSQIINKNHKKLAQGWPECWKPTYPYSGEALSKMNLGVTALKTYILSTWKDSCKKTIKKCKTERKKTLLKSQRTRSEPHVSPVPLGQAGSLVAEVQLAQAQPCTLSLAQK